MKVLIAEDDPISRRLLRANLERFGHEVIETCNGREAWEKLRADAGPKLAVLDWMMPEVDGVQVCRQVRADEQLGYVYVILLTAKGRRDDLVEAFGAGVDDYLTKPFDPHELRSRLSVGERLLTLQGTLETKVEELEDALAHVQQLQGLIPICMHCKRIRDDKDAWHRMETYIEERSDANFTHSLCTECLSEHYPKFQEKVLAKQQG